MKRPLAVLLLLVALLVAPAASAASRILFVYLPDAPVESASKVAEAIAGLGGYLERATPGVTFELKAFRRAEDALALLDGRRDDIAVLVADTSLVAELPDSFVPFQRFLRAGRESVKKVVVVRADSPFHALEDLEGRSLSSSFGAGRTFASAIGRLLLEGRKPADKYFSRLDHASDGASAVADVLLGKADAAMVEEGNPILAAKSKDLRTVFTTAAVLLPVVALREGAFNAEQQAAIEKALRELDRAPDGRSVLGFLRFDGIRKLETVAVAPPPPPVERKPRSWEVALPPSDLRLTFPAPPSVDDLPMPGLVTIPDVPVEPATGGS